MIVAHSRNRVYKFSSMGSGKTPVRSAIAALARTDIEVVILRGQKAGRCLYEQAPMEARPLPQRFENRDTAPRRSRAGVFAATGSRS